jgi:KaiC/GvpD/RAD55 family RecA-like ATPase
LAFAAKFNIQGTRMKTRIIFASVATFFSFLSAGASQEGDKKETNGRPAMPIYITPFYDSKGLKVSVGDTSKKLASADAKTILEVSSELKKERDKLRAEVMYVAAIRLYDLGHKDEAVYWFYTAQYRARVFTSILDKEKVGNIGSEAFELKQAYASFNQLAGEYINGYAFGELPKFEKTLLKVVEEGKSLPKFGDVYPKVKFVDEDELVAAIQTTLNTAEQYAATPWETRAISSTKLTRPR